MSQNPFIPTAYQAHMQKRLYLRSTLTDLREQGTPLPELIEVLRNELQLLTIELDKSESNANTI